MIPLFLAAVFAILCHPVYSRLRKYLPPWGAGLTLTLSLLLGFLGPIITILIGGTHQLVDFLSQVKFPTGAGTQESLLQYPWLRNVIRTLEQFVPSDREWIREQSLSLIHTTIQKLSGLLAMTLSNVPNIALGSVILVLSFYFFMVDGDRLLRFLGNLSPMKYEKTEELFVAFQSSCRGVVLGLFFSAVVQGTIMFAFAYLTGAPHAMLWGIATMVLSLVPLFGSAPVGIGLTIYLFSNGHPVAGTFMAVGAVVIGITDNVVRSWVMKGEAEMHPLLALVSVFGALHLFGASGIFLGPIIAAVFVSFLKIVVGELQKEHGTAITLPINLT